MNGYRSIDGLRSIMASFDHFLIDQFGVLHDGSRAYDGAIDCLDRLKAAGKTVVLLSNSGKRANANRARLRDFGFPERTFDQVVTSGEVTWQGIVDHAFGPPFVPGSRVYLLGHDDYDYGLDQIGMQLVDDPSAADFILIAASRAPRMSLDQYKLALAAPARSGIPALCSNPDRLMLTVEGLQPSAGEIAALYAELGGRVSFVGKPHPAIYEAAIKRSPRSTVATMLAIGDSVEHDICGANRAGIATALVKSGLSADADEDQLRREVRRYGAAPDFVLPGLRW